MSGHDDLARFWVKVDRRGSDECWPWLSGTAKGYGRYSSEPRHRGSTQVQAHRFAYELLVGPIPEGLTLDHLCRNRLCVNPAHLEPTTMRENTLRSPVALAAVNARKTHCVNGHEFTAENTYWHKTKTGRGRRCRKCDQQTRRRRTLRAKAARA